jgi:L-2-hydroxyglutarate oxidase LhgO
MPWWFRLIERVDSVVIGAGVIGLACARALAWAGREVVLLERHSRIGEEISSRNSEVIHAGIYYPEHSAKAHLCVRGKELLYRYCAEHQIPHQRCGKLIVATNDAQLEILRDYQRRALINGAGELPWLDREAVARLEPAIRCVAGVYSETTGIIDSHSLMDSLLGEIEQRSGALALGTEAMQVASTGKRFRIETADLELEADLLVNASGLSAPRFAAQMNVSHRDELPLAYFAKGHYYQLSGRSPFSHLVYPIAEAGGLGVHVTLDLGGAARFGPDVSWCDEPDYQFDESNRDDFVSAIRGYYPDLDESHLHPAYTGVRPKISPAGSEAADFSIRGPAQHGVAGLVHLFGIESPGLTACLAIAERVTELLLGPLQPATDAYS